MQKTLDTLMKAQDLTYRAELLLLEARELVSDPELAIDSFNGIELAARSSMQGALTVAQTSVGTAHQILGKLQQLVIEVTIPMEEARYALKQ